MEMTAAAATSTAQDVAYFQSNWTTFVIIGATFLAGAILIFGAVLLNSDMKKTIHYIHETNFGCFIFCLGLIGYSICLIGFFIKDFYVAYWINLGLMIAVSFIVAVIFTFTIYREAHDHDQTVQHDDEETRIGASSESDSQKREATKRQ
jgi:Ca2+/Na+ antiporter